MLSSATVPCGSAASAFGWGESSSEHALYMGMIAPSDGTASKVFDVQLIGSSGQRNLACNLLNKMYGWRGYGTNHKLGKSRYSTTFAASIEGEVSSTLTLTVDSAAGLAADKTFGDVIELARTQPGARLCELTKFAGQPSNESKYLLASLFHTIFIFGTEQYGCTDLFIEVNPRHVRFYESMLGFDRIGDTRTNEAVKAPSQLMRLKVADIARYIGLYADSEERTTSRSLYPFFFSVEEEEQVRQRVAAISMSQPRRPLKGRPAISDLTLGRAPLLRERVAA